MPSRRVHIFDADGVVIRSWGFADVLEERYGITRHQTRSFFKGPFRECLIGRASLRGALVPFLTEWGWPESVDEFVHLWMTSDDQPVDDLLAVVRDLREAGETCCLASNQEAVRADYLRHEMGFAKQFDALFFSCDLGLAKPDPEFFRTVNARLSSPDMAVFFWDDDLRNVQAAVEVGWQATVYETVESVTGLVGC